MGNHDGVIDVEGQVPAPGQLTQRSADLGRLAATSSASSSTVGGRPVWANVR